MTSSRTLKALAFLIQSRIDAIDSAIQQAAWPAPSLDLGASFNDPVPDTAKKDREELLEAIDELRALLLGPIELLAQEGFIIVRQPALFDVLTHFKIPEHIGLNETISYAELADRCNASEPDISRFVRAAISLRIFEEPEEGKVKHNAVSAAMASIPELLPWMESGMTFSIGSLRSAESLDKYPGSLDPSEAPFALAGPNQQDFFTMMKQNPDMAQKFSTSMTFRTMIPSTGMSPCVSGVDWDTDCPNIIVDVGGSHGILSKKLLARYPIQKATVQDLPDVVGTQKVPPDLEGRLTFMPYNFFEEQPMKNADVYLFRNVFHDWPDDFCIKILRNQVTALKAGAKIIINDVCLEVPGSLTLVRDRLARTNDILMKVGFNGRERTADDWRAILARADERFEITSIVTPPGSALAIIKISWQG